MYLYFKLCRESMSDIDRREGRIVQREREKERQVDRERKRKRERERERESEICFISLIKRVVELYWTEIPEIPRPPGNEQ